MKAIDRWLDKEFEKALGNTKEYVRQQKINKAFTIIGLIMVTTVTLKILNIF